MAEAIPSVTFSAESAPVLDCVLWLGRSLVQGKLGEAAKDHPAETVLVISRVVEMLARTLDGSDVLVMQAPEMHDALVLLQEQLGVQSLNAEGLASGPLRGLILQKLLELLMEFIADWIDQASEG